MTAPDTVKPSDGLQHMMLGVCDGFDGCDVCVIAPEKYDAQMADHARIVAEKDARIAHLQRGFDAAVATVVASEAERDALKAQLADAVETLKGLSVHQGWNRQDFERTPMALASDCLKRIGVTP
jgi:hypothetical protein